MKTQYRYKEATGVTQFAIRGLKHLHKLGKITKIIGYRYVALYKWGPRVDDRIKVFGENGIALFSGFGYGYSGEGPRGTIELFKAVGVPTGTDGLYGNTPSIGDTCAYYIRRSTCGVTINKPVVDWRLELVDEKWQITHENRLTNHEKLHHHHQG